MTFDTAGTPSNDAPLDPASREGAAAEGTAPATKPARRRATRTAAAPAAPTDQPAAAAQPVVPEPVAPAAPATPEPATAAAPPATEPAPAPAAAPRRSRRVTRTVVLPEPGAATTADAPSTPAAAPAPSAEAASAAEPAAEAALAADAPATEPVRTGRRERTGQRSTRATRAAQPAGSEAPAQDAAPTPDAPTASAPAEAPQAESAAEPAAPKKRAPRRSRKAAEAPAPEPAPVVELPEDEEDEDALAGTDPTSTSGTPAPAAAATPPAAPALDVLAELAGTVASKPPVEQRTGSPRLATTALLFQAPDPDARPRRRRASSPAGSPQAISEAAAALHTPPAPAQEQAPVETAAEDKPASTRPSRRRGRRGAQAEAPTEEPTVLLAGTDAPATEVEPDAEVVDEDLVAPVEPVQDEDTDEQRPADADDADDSGPRRRRRRGGRGRRGRNGAEDDEAAEDEDGPRAAEPDAETEGDADTDDTDAEADEQGGSSRRRRRRRRSGRGEGAEPEVAAPSRSRSSRAPSDEVTALRGSTRLEAKRQRRREGRDAGRRRQIITESEFLARRESVERTMVVRERDGRTQIAVLEDGVLVEHYVSRQAQLSMAGNVYLGRVQNVLPSMEAAFVDVGKGRNAVLYAGEVNWDAAGLEGQPRRIEQALKSGDSVLVQVTKDPMGHKGARLTSQITLAGRYLVYVPGGGMTGISRKLPDVERNRLKKILREIVPESAGVIVRTAAEGASEDELRADIARLQGQWESISKKAKTASAPALLQGEPDLAIRVVRDIFNDDFSSLVVQGAEAWSTISGYIGDLAPDLASKVTRWTAEGDVFAAHRVDEQLAKGMDRKVWLPSGGSLVIDRTEAMTVVDVNTGKFTGSGGTLEETVTRNNLEAAEEIVRQLRLRDIGGIIVIDFIDMVLELNRDLVLRRLVECLGRDRTKHQVAEVTSLGLVQMTRKRVGQGLVEAFSETCEHCNGRGFIVHADPIEKSSRPEAGAPQQQAPASVPAEGDAKRSRRKRGGKDSGPTGSALPTVPVLPEAREAVKATLATIAAAAAHAHDHAHDHDHALDQAPASGSPVTGGAVRVAEDPAQAEAGGAGSGDERAVPDAGAGSTPSEATGATFRGAEGELPEPAAAGAAGVGGLDEAPGDERLELTPVDPSTFDLADTDDADEPDADDVTPGAAAPVADARTDDGAAQAADRDEAEQPADR